VLAVVEVPVMIVCAIEGEPIRHEEVEAVRRARSKVRVSHCSVKSVSLR
jgi:hypothetical protein